MMKKLAVVAAIAGLMMSSAMGSTWLAVQDAEGISWARIKFVNNSSEPSGWAISNGRAAVESSAGGAVTDRAADWDGIVEAGATEYVWVYGYLSGEVTIGNTDGGNSTFLVGIEPLTDGEGELVITIASDRTVDAVIDASASYGVPAHNGELPEAPEE